MLIIYAVIPPKVEEEEAVQLYKYVPYIAVTPVAHLNAF
jgi:hypothetical protein